MRYLGGKYRIRKWIAAEVGRFRKPGQPIWEPFCGGLNSAAAHGGHVICSDASESLIALYQAVAGGWQPPTRVTEEAYRAARELPRTNPMHGFCEFGCSFGGKSWGGFARDSAGGNYAAGSAKTLLRDVPKITGFFPANFTECKPGPTGCLIYCDPPYADTTGYRTGTFDHETFYLRCKEWAKHTTVLVSEYALPTWAGVEIASKVRNAGLRSSKKTDKPTERLFLVLPP